MVRSDGSGPKVRKSEGPKLRRSDAHRRTEGPSQCTLAPRLVAPLDRV